MSEGFTQWETGVSLPIADVPSKLPCCGVFATALAARVDFRTVWNLMAAHRKRPGAWKGRTGDKDRERAMKALGVKFRFSRMARPVTVSRFAEFHTKPGVRYVLASNGHIMYLEAGVLSDQYESRVASEHKHARYRVVKYWELVE
ncbi:hypothetical protein [Sphingomonas phage Kimi]|nr:hypothetical protein [Sphingomonas phage Kimi]